MEGHGPGEVMHRDPQPRLRQERNVCEACTVAGSGTLGPAPHPRAAAFCLRSTPVQASGVKSFLM